MDGLRVLAPCPGGGAPARSQARMGSFLMRVGRRRLGQWSRWPVLPSASATLRANWTHGSRLMDIRGDWLVMRRSVGGGGVSMTKSTARFLGRRMDPVATGTT